MKAYREKQLQHSDSLSACYIKATRHSAPAIVFGEISFGVGLEIHLRRDINRRLTIHHWL